MRLTTEVLARFVGGQMEIQNQSEGYIHRGEIEEVAVEGEMLQVKFAWCAKGEEYPSIPTRWVKDDLLEYGLSLVEGFTSISDIGQGDSGSSRICIQSVLSGETIVLFPPDGSRLDRNKVVGLDPVSA